MVQKKITIDLNGIPKFDMILVEGGSFSMGDDEGEYADEKPAHRVKLDRFYLAEYPVTQKLWEALMGENPSRYKGDTHPVEMISREDTSFFWKRPVYQDYQENQVYHLIIDQPPAFHPPNLLILGSYLGVCWELWRFYSFVKK